MFRKIVSNLAFSPALVGQLGFYAKRLRKEEATRRIGLMFTVLALIVQSFAVFSPPESANAASSSDFIRGGVSSLHEYVGYYDRNSNNIKDIFTSLGITREEVRSAQAGTINSKDVLSWGMTSRFSAAQGERTYKYEKSNGVTKTVYYRPLRLWDSKPYTIQHGSTYAAYIGHSKKFGWFALMKVCGNLVTKKSPPPAPKPKPAPKPTTPKVVPVAACSAIQAIVSNRTIVQLSGEATTSGGASVKQYDFSLTDASGATIATRSVKTDRLTASADSISLSKPGTYTAKLSVATSEGKKTSRACQHSVTIAAPAVCSFTPTLPASSPECQPCAGDLSLWIKDENCTSKLVQTKTASNLTQGDKNATTVLAMPSNRIAYQVNVKNSGLAPITTPISEHLDDVLEYASIIDSGGGSFNKDTKTLTWPDVTLEPGQQQTRLFVIQLARTIPAVAQGKSNHTSYDCTMTNTFGNTVSIAVDCPAPKVVEQVVGQLPHTGAGANTIFAGVVLATVVYFYARSRQLKTEVRLIRRDLNAGTL